MLHLDLCYPVRGRRRNAGPPSPGPSTGPPPVPISTSRRSVTLQTASFKAFVCTQIARSIHIWLELVKLIE